MKKLQKKQLVCVAVTLRVRGKVSGTPERPVPVHHAQQLQHLRSGYRRRGGQDLLRSFHFRPWSPRRPARTYANVEGAAVIGELIGKKATAAGITEVVFDRGGNLYHGRIKAVADGAREAGLKF